MDSIGFLKEVYWNSIGILWASIQILLEIDWSPVGIYWDPMEFD